VGLRRAALGQLVARQESLAEARRLGVLPSWASVDLRLRKLIAGQFAGSSARLRAELSREGLVMSDLRWRVRAELAREALEGRLGSRIEIGRAAVVTFYAKHKAALGRPDSRRVVGSLAEAGRLRLRLLHGTSFARLARRYSLDGMARRNGGLVTVFRGQAVAAFDRVVFSLGSGAISAPVHTPFGWHLIQALGGIEQGRQPTLAQAAPLIREQLRQLELQPAFSHFLDGLAVRWRRRVRYVSQVSACGSLRLAGRQ
jgi:peptidyl-prolyl cis-trans isomerase SurA